MKKLFCTLFLIIFIFPAMAGAGNEKINKKSCTFKGKKLYGKVKVVENFPELKVKIVNNFPDLKVKWVQNFPDKCGKWQTEANFPDLKIKFVENFPDIKVQFVDNFPGIP